MVRKVSEHSKQINDIQMSKDNNCFITASKDFTAKVHSASMPQIFPQNSRHFIIFELVCSSLYILCTRCMIELNLLGIFLIQREICSFIFQLFDTYSLDLMKTYKTDRPVNSAAIAPTKPHVSWTFSSIQLHTLDVPPIIHNDNKCYLFTRTKLELNWLLRTKIIITAASGLDYRALVNEINGFIRSPFWTALDCIETIIEPLYSMTTVCN